MGGGYATAHETIKSALQVGAEPGSASARPLEAAVLDGVALGRAHTRYAIRQVAGEGEPVVVLDAVFTFRFTAKTLQRLASTDASGAWLAEETPAVVLLSRV